MASLVRSFQIVVGQLRRWAPILAALYIQFESSPLVWAAKKKKEEAGPAAKSYTLPYMIVIAVVALGLMTVLRPGKRQDEGANLNKKDKDED
ncbi:MAG TPA: hypothetical protein VGJ16_11650 [Pirellulales bacterium]|jgi:hypothetical protein